MNKLISVLILMLMFTGCAFNRHVVITVEGKNVKTPYGSGDDLTITIDKILSSCPEVSTEKE